MCSFYYLLFRMSSVTPMSLVTPMRSSKSTNRKFLRTTFCDCPEFFQSFAVSSNLLFIQVYFRCYQVVVFFMNGFVFALYSGFFSALIKHVCLDNKFYNLKKVEFCRPRTTTNCCVEADSLVESCDTVALY